jgi:hypothetical protein
VGGACTGGEEPRGPPCTAVVETVWWSPTRAEQSHAHRTTNPSSMDDDCRVERLRARLQALRSEAAEVEVELEAVLAARAAGVSPWGSELPSLFLQQLLEHLRWDKATCRAIRATCSTWCGVHDALRPGGLELRWWMTGMEGKLGFFESVETLRLHSSDAYSGHLEELRSMPSLKSIWLPSRYAERAVDATALCSLTGLTSLLLDGGKETVLKGVEEEEEVGEWVLELGGFIMLTSLILVNCTVTDAEVLAVGTKGTLTALTTLVLFNCVNVTDVAVGALSGLTGLTELGFDGCKVTDVGVGTLSGLTALTELSLSLCKVTDVGVGTLSGLTGLTGLVQGDGRGSGDAEQPHSALQARPRRLPLADRRGSKRLEQPHSAIHSRPPRLPQRHRRRVARTPHRLPQPNDCRLSTRAVHPASPHPSDHTRIQASARRPSCRGAYRL